MSSKYYSPYIDMTLPSDLGKLARQSGLGDFTLAFMQGRDSELSGSGADAHLKLGVVPTLSWGGFAPDELPTQKIASQIEHIQANRGTITISFGGYGGRDAAVIANQYSENLQDGPKHYSEARADRIAVNHLASEYQSVIDTYGVSQLDFDIEPDTITGDEKDLYDVVGDKAANHLRDLAINKLKAANPDLKVSFTVATQPDGLPHDPSYIGGNVLGILKQAKADHVDLDVVNIMAMDYFSGIKHPDMGQLAIDAAKATHKQLVHLGMGDVKVAITPMIGQNDNWQDPKTSEVFTLEDARHVTAFAAKTSWITGIGMWELPRDMAATKDTTNHEPTSHRSGVIQEQWEFSSIFDQVSGHPSAAGDDQFVFDQSIFGGQNLSPSEFLL
jgi:chitinase